MAASKRITDFFAPNPEQAQRKRIKLTEEDETGNEASSSSDIHLCCGSSKQKVGFGWRWEKIYPWVYLADDGKGMYCKLCRRYNTKNERNHSAVFNDTPCVSLRRDALVRHASSDMHAAAVSMEQERFAAGGIQTALQVVVSAERMAVTTAMKCLYWLAKNEIPHTTKYQPLLELLQHLNCPHLGKLHLGANATYTSEMIMQEFIQVMGSQIEKNCT